MKHGIGVDNIHTVFLFTKHEMKHYFWAVIWAFLVLIFISMPMSGVPASNKFFIGMDKLVHTVFFFVFTILMFWGSIRNNNRSSLLNYHLVILGVGSIFAISTELIQKFIFTYRGFEYWDIFADHVGIAMGYFAYLILVLATKRFKE